MFKSFRPSSESAVTRSKHPKRTHMSTNTHTHKHTNTHRRKLACTRKIISAGVYTRPKRVNVICQTVRTIMSSVSENKHTYNKLVLVQAPMYSIPRSIELAFDQLFIDFFVSKRNEITISIPLRS
jgi:hypothetical protein